MTVFQHASVAPTSELVGRELQGRSFVPIMQVAKTRESEESARCLLLKDIVTDEQ